jgi:hypothetical protein
VRKLLWSARSFGRVRLYSIGADLQTNLMRSARQRTGMSDCLENCSAGVSPAVAGASRSRVWARCPRDSGRDARATSVQRQGGSKLPHSKAGSARRIRSCHSDSSARKTKDLYFSGGFRIL